MKIDDTDDYKRKRIAFFAQNGAKHGDLGKMCNTCAFKLNSEANLEPHNVNQAFECLAHEMQFNCHKEIGIDKGCECVGFKYAKQYFEKLNV